MKVELRIPEIGESISEVVIGEWLKAEGDYVERDEDVVVVESDKATVEIPAPESGNLVKILKQSGETATVGEVIGRFDSAESETAESKRSPTKRKAASVPEVGGSDAEENGSEEAETHEEDGRGERERKQKKTAEPARPAKGFDDKAAQAKDVKTRGRERPDEKTKKEQAESAEFEQEATESTDSAELAGREATEKQNDDEKTETNKPETIANEAIDEVKAREKSATDDRDGKQSHEPRPRSKIISQEEASDERPAVDRDRPKVDGEKIVSAPIHRWGREEKSVPMTSIRQRIAERLVQAQQTTAYLSTFNEIDMSAVAAIRQQYQDDFQKTYNIKLGLMSFFVRASIEALKLIPQVNAEIRGTDIVYREYYDIAVAVGGGKGLVVPVLRNAETMSFAEVEQAIDEFARKAKKISSSPTISKAAHLLSVTGGFTVRCYLRRLSMRLRAGYSACTLSRSVLWSAMAK